MKEKEKKEESIVAPRALVDSIPFFFFRLFRLLYLKKDRKKEKRQRERERKKERNKRKERKRYEMKVDVLGKSGLVLW